MCSQMADSGSHFQKQSQGEVEKRIHSTRLAGFGAGPGGPRGARNETAKARQGGFSGGGRGRVLVRPPAGVFAVRY